MKSKYIFSLAVSNISHRKMRSWLTILGIIIGVASIVSLISISMGLSEDINERMNLLGTNIIQISPGGGQAQKGGNMGMGMIGGGGGAGPSGSPFGSSKDDDALTFRDADELKSIIGVDSVDARLEERADVMYIDENTSLSIIGTEPEAFPESCGADILYGRYLSTSDLYSAVLGYKVANSTFDNEATSEMLNQQIKIEGVYFKVVGILEESGSSGFTSADNAIFIPQKTARTLFSQDKNASSVLVIVNKNYDTDEIASKVEETLLELHGLTEDEADFQITTASSIQSTASDITDTLGLFLGAIASISLIVGGIGVANTMFMSVLEQTKEIGILKALGAKNNEILTLFIFESGIIGFIGGFIGILLSFFVSYLMTLFSVPTKLTPELLFGGLFFSIIIGIIAGFAPARGAAKIPPIEALKYE